MGKNQKRQQKKLPQPVAEVLEEQTVPLFVEDTVGGFKGVPKTLRDNALVMDRSGKVPFSKGEEQLVKKLTIKKTAPPKKPENRKSQLSDIWSTEAPSKRKMKPMIGNFESLAVPAVKLPHAGQSVNPEISVYTTLVEEVASREISDPKPAQPEIASRFARDASLQASTTTTEKSEICGKKAAERKTTADRNREERHRKLLEEHGKNRGDKKISAQINHLPALLKEASTEEKEAQTRAENLENFRSERIRQIAKGRVSRRGAGGNFRELPEALALLPEAGSLRRVQASSSNPISEVMRGIFRRRLLEQPAVLDADYANKLKHRNLQKNKRKFHDALARDIALMR